MKKNKKILYAAAALFTLTVLFSTAIFTFVGIKSIFWGRAPQSGKDSQDMEKKWQGLEKTRTDWQNIEAEYKNFRREYMLLDVDFANFRSNLDALIGSNNLMRKSISYSINELSSLKLKHYKVTLSLAGDYPSMKKFIFDVENIKEMVYITHITLNQEKSLLSGLIELEAYFAQ